MNIYTPENMEEVIITVSPLEYKRLYEIIEDHACEYGTKGDIIFNILKNMEKFNRECDNKIKDG